jgi:hypothetical protein
MATARKSQLIRTEKVDSLNVGDWDLMFTYKYVGDENPTEVNVTGNKKGGGLVTVNAGQMGMDNYNINFNPSSCFDIELVKKFHDEILLIKG